MKLLRRRSRARSFEHLQTRLESGDLSAIAEIGPSLYDRLGPSVFEQAKLDHTGTSAAA